MALIKFGAGIADMRGSIGGVVFSRNRFGAIARNRTKPVDPSSAYQQVMRQAVQTLAILWRTVLTADQRDEWATYAANVAWINALGETQYLTGFNMYVRSNCSIAQAGLTRVDDGPSELSLPAADSTFAVAATADDQKLAITFDDTADWCDLAGNALLIYCSMPTRATVNFFKGPYRFVDAIEGSVGSPPTTGTELDLPFVCATGQKVFVQARLVTVDGRLSQPFRGSCLCAAS